MNALQKLFAWLGFDPIALSGAPDDFELLYLVGLLSAFSLGIAISVKIPFFSAAKYRFILMAVLVVSIWLLLFIRDSLTISFIEPASSSPLNGTAQRVETRVAIPLPGLRSEKFPYVSGSQKMDSATSASYLEESHKAENVLAVRATLALHWLTFVVFLTASVSASGLALKAVFAPVLQWVRMKLKPSSKERA